MIRRKPWLFRWTALRPAKRALTPTIPFLGRLARNYQRFLDFVSDEPLGAQDKLTNPANFHLNANPHAKSKFLACG